jgi:hypothetical protein
MKENLSAMRRSIPGFERDIGYVTILFSALLLVLFGFNVHSRVYYHGPDYSFLGWLAAYTGFVGLGLVRRRKWAAILFVIPSFTSGILIGVGSLMRVPFPWMVVNVGVGLLLCWISLLLLGEWKKLKW